MKITQIDRKDIITALQARSVTMKELAAAYGVSSPRISQIYKEETGTRVSELPALSQEICSGDVIQFPINLDGKEKVSFNDILELLSTFKKENPEYRVTFDFNIKLKMEHNFMRI